MEFQDRVLQCTDPAHADNTAALDAESQSVEFVFSAEEQAFFAENSFDDPKRCPACRAAKKSHHNNRNRERQMHSVVCYQCGREDQVPFQPKGDRPVYCSDCFQQQKAAA